MKDNRYMAAGVICPNYRCQTRNSLICGGIGEGCNYHMAFSSAAAAKAQLNSRCRASYGECPFYRAVIGNAEN